MRHPTPAGPTPAGPTTPGQTTPGPAATAPTTTGPPRAFTLALAAVTALGPLSTDLYLASLPAIGAEFASPAWATQMTLTAYLLVLGISQLVAGPLTDAWGRRRLLLAGLAMFAGASLLAMVADGLAALIVARLIQGAGAGLAFVVATSSVRDRTSGADSAKLFAHLMTVSAAAPILAPVLGGFLDESFGWRAVFGTLAAIGVAVMAMAWFWLPESLPRERRIPASLGQAFAGYGAVLSDRRFLLPLGALSAAFVFLFAYIGGSPYVYQGHYGLEPAAFGLAFGATGIAVLAGAQASSLLARRWRSRKVALLGTAVLAAGPCVGLLTVLVADSLVGLAIGMGLGLLGLGIAEPALMAIAMGTRENSVGAAAGLIGAAQFVLGALATATAGIATGAGPGAWAGLMAVAGLGVLALCPRRGRTTRAAATPPSYGSTS